jgi:hypothetical protein
VLGDRTFGARASGPDVTVRGDVVLSFDGDARGESYRWAQGKGVLRVTRLSSGRELYRLRSGAIKRAAKAPASAGVSVTLRDDGSLGTQLSRSGSTASGLRSVRVSRDGRVVRGPWFPGATSLATTYRSGRYLTSVSAGPAQRDTEGCFAWWITNAAGTRGLTLPARDASGFERGAILQWTPSVAVFSTSKPSGDPERSDQDGIRVDSGLTRTGLHPLSKPGTRTTCRPR